jgi:hypothetical protein
MLGKYTTLGEGKGGLVSIVKVVRIDLTRHLASSISLLHDEIQEVVPRKFGSSPNWTPVPLYETLARIVAQVTARVFVGLPLCRDEEWVFPLDFWLLFVIDEILDQSYG